MKIKATSSFYLLHYGVFDCGDILDVNEKLAEKLVNQGVSEYIENKPQAKEEDKLINNIDFSELKVAELKKLLIEKGIEIPKGAKKKDLVQLLEEMK